MALALGSRRSTIATVASALAAMAVAIAVAGRSCRGSHPGPEVTVRDMLRAAKAGDVDAVYELLSPATRERLEVEARRATDYVGAAIRYAPKDLISIGNSEGIVTPTDITVVEEHEQRAVVLIVSAAGRAHVDLVRIDGAWRIDIPAYRPLER